MLAFSNNLLPRSPSVSLTFPFRLTVGGLGSRLRIRFLNRGLSHVQTREKCIPPSADRRASTLRKLFEGSDSGRVTISSSLRENADTVKLVICFPHDSA